jgi:hypothetical protein
MPGLENYTDRDFKTGSQQFWTILQDSRGLMYFGPSGGSLLQFDGATWRSIFIGGEIVRSLMADDQGKVWLGLAEDFGYLAPNNLGAMHYVSILDKIPADQREFTDIWQMVATPQGIYFRAYERLFRWDGKQMHSWAAAPHSRFQALASINGHLYTSENGIGLQEIVGDELRNVSGGEAYKNSAKLFIYPYDDGRILISARDQGFTLFDGQKAVPFPTQADDYLKSHRLYSSTLLRDGSICATTLDGGAVLLEHDGRLRQIIDERAGLGGSTTLTAYQDREGALWLGLQSGVTRVDVESPVSVFSRTDTIDVMRFKGSIYVTSGGGSASVQRLTSDPRTGRPLLVPIPGVSQAFYLTIFHDPSGKTPDQLLAATSDGPMRIEGDKLTPLIPSLRDNSRATYGVFQPKSDPDRILLTRSDGVSMMRWDGRIWVDEGKLPNLSYDSRNIAEDAHGVLWVSGGSGHIGRIQLGTSKTSSIRVDLFGEAAGLSLGVEDAESIDGKIYVTAEHSKNILRWDDSTHKFVVDNRFALPVDSPDASTVYQQQTYA